MDSNLCQVQPLIFYYTISLTSYGLMRDGQVLISYGPFCWTNPVFKITVSMVTMTIPPGIFLCHTGSHSRFNMFSPLLSTSAPQMSGAVRQVCLHLFIDREAQAALYRYSSVYTYLIDVFL